MGIISDDGIPVYLNETFVDQTDITLESITDQPFWELPFWSFDGIDLNPIIEAVERISFEGSFYQFQLQLEQEELTNIDLFFYPTPLDYEPDERMMWIFEFRHPNHNPIPFPLRVASLTKITK